MCRRDNKNINFEKRVTVRCQKIFKARGMIVYVFFTTPKRYANIGHSNIGNSNICNIFQNNFLNGRLVNRKCVLRYLNRIPNYYSTRIYESKNDLHTTFCYIPNTRHEISQK